jgi:hypothetical protein
MDGLHGHAPASPHTPQALSSLGEREGGTERLEEAGASLAGAHGALEPISRGRRRRFDVYLTDQIEVLDQVPGVLLQEIWIST